MSRIKYKFERQEGWSYACEYARKTDGSYPAEVFEGGLNDRVAAKITALVERLLMYGVIHNKEQFKFLKGNFKPIAEVKVFQTRMLCYLAGERRAIVLTNGFTKKRDNTPPSEVERAKSIQEEYEEWLKNAQQ